MARSPGRKARQHTRARKCWSRNHAVEHANGTGKNWKLMYLRDQGQRKLSVENWLLYNLLFACWGITAARKHRRTRSSTAVAETIESRRTMTCFFSEAAEKELLSTRHLVYNSDRIGIFENQGCPDVLIGEFDEEELAIRRRAAAELFSFCVEQSAEPWWGRRLPGSSRSRCSWVLRCDCERRVALAGSETKRMDQTEKHNLQSNGQGTHEQHKYGRTDRPWRHRGFVAAGSERAKALVATPLHRLGSEKVSILHPKPCDFHSWVLNTQNCTANTNTVETNRSSAAATARFQTRKQTAIANISAGIWRQKVASLDGHGCRVRFGMSWWKEELRWVDATICSKKKEVPSRDARQSQKVYEGKQQLSTGEKRDDSVFSAGRGLPEWSIPSHETLVGDAVGRCKTLIVPHKVYAEGDVGEACLEAKESRWVPCKLHSNTFM